MTHPDKPELKGKPNSGENPDPDFQRGFDAGKIATSPSPVVIFRLEVAEERARKHGEAGVSFSPNVAKRTAEGDHQARLYVDGYISGLAGFLSEQGLINVNPPIGLISPIILREVRALSGFVDGLGRKHPGSNYGVFDRTKDYTKLTQREKPSQVEYEENARRSGYVLGFAVGIARDFSIRVNLADIPEDDEDFVAFNLGINGDTRQLRQPVYREVSGRKYQDFYEQQRELRNQGAYELGLLVRLRQQGIEGVEASQILSSALALNAFKTALEGGVMPQFEIPHKVLWRLTPLGELEKSGLVFQGRRRNLIKKNDKERKVIANTPTIDDVREANERRGYELGKQAREQRLARERTASDQQTPPQQ